MNIDEIKTKKKLTIDKIIDQENLSETQRNRVYAYPKGCHNCHHCNYVNEPDGKRQS